MVVKPSQNVLLTSINGMKFNIFVVICFVCPRCGSILIYYSFKIVLRFLLAQIP